MIEPMIAQIFLPLPPSLNAKITAYPTKRGIRVATSKRVKEWESIAAGVLFEQRPPRFGARPVVVSLDIHFPDNGNKTGDLDNYLKSTLDALTKADIWDDDDQIISLMVKKRALIPGGVIHITIIEASDIDIDQSQRQTADRPKEWRLL